MTLSYIERIDIADISGKPADLRVLVKKRTDMIDLDLL